MAGLSIAVDGKLKTYIGSHEFRSADILACTSKEGERVVGKESKDEGR